MARLPVPRQLRRQRPRSTSRRSPTTTRSRAGRRHPGTSSTSTASRPVPEPLTGLTANADNLADAIEADVLAGRLPQVSWVVSNQAFSEHPDGAPNDGAYLLDRVLKALHADPDVFDRPS